RFPHQRGIGRKPLYGRLAIQFAHAGNIGAIRENLDGELVETPLEQRITPGRGDETRAAHVGINSHSCLHHDVTMTGAARVFRVARSNAPRARPPATETERAFAQSDVDGPTPL